MDTCNSCGKSKPMDYRHCPSCHTIDREAALRGDRLKAKKPLLWATLWLAGAVWVLVMCGNPFRGLSLIWAGQTAVAHYVETNEEEVDGDGAYRGQGGIVETHTYAFIVNEKPYSAYSSSSDLSERESVKYLPDDPSIAVVDGKGHDSVTSQVVSIVFRNLVVIFLPLIVSIFFARHGLKKLKKIRDRDYRKIV